MSEAPEGFHYEWVDEPSDRWQVYPLDDRTCRMRGCTNTAVIRFKRVNHGAKLGWSWWHYCGDHMYGRRIKDGHVQSRRLVPDDPA